MLSREYSLQRPIDLWGTIGPLRYGRDPSWRRIPGGFAKASLTPIGPGLEVVTVEAKTGHVSGEFHGPGGPWLADRLPDLLGANDEVNDFDPPEVLALTWRRRPGLRVPRSGLVFEAFVPVVLGQKVTGVEAFASYRRLLMKFGTPVGCGPFPELIVPPSPEKLGERPLVGVAPSRSWPTAVPHHRRGRSQGRGSRTAHRCTCTAGPPRPTVPDGRRRMDRRGGGPAGTRRRRCAVGWGLSRCSKRRLRAHWTYRRHGSADAGIVGRLVTTPTPDSATRRTRPDSSAASGAALPRPRLPGDVIVDLAIWARHSACGSLRVDYLVVRLKPWRHGPHRRRNGGRIR